MSELARQLAARRKRADRQCEVCGAVMPEALARRRFCSNTCTQRAYRARRAVERRAGEVDTEPLAPETEAMVAASRAAYARGEYATQAELAARLGLRES
jgi:hypothetical protein